MTDGDDPRRARLARALRANLRRRKTADETPASSAPPVHPARRDEPPETPESN